MMQIGLFYGSDSGATAKVARTIKAHFADSTMALPVDVARASPTDLLAHDLLIVGTPTVGIGDLPYDWEILLERMVSADFSGKTVAVFGLGDQFCYGDSFADGVGTLTDFFAEHGAKVVGAWPVDGYEYAASLAEREGRFTGLVLDEDNQPGMTKPRLTQWLNQIAPDFGFTALN